MSTNKTQNFGLHSWAAEDDFLRSEFNENFALLDESLRMVFGSYVGCAADHDFTPVHIDLGRKPRAVIIAKAKGGMSQGSGGAAYGGIFAEGFEIGGCIKIDETGFFIQNETSENSIYFNRSGYGFYYLALL